MLEFAIETMDDETLDKEKAQEASETYMNDLEIVIFIFVYLKGNSRVEKYK